MWHNRLDQQQGDHEMSDQHLRSEHYALLGDHPAASTLARRLHTHLIQDCPECREAWEQLGHLQGTVHVHLAHLSPTAAVEPTDDEILVDDEVLAAEDASIETLRYLRRRAYRQLWELRQLSPAQRASRIRGAHRQFRGRALAELLIEEARSLVRNAPLKAIDWVDLVALVLHWTRGEDAPAWAAGLLARAAAHRANALRIAGDFVSAERAFIEVRRRLATQTVNDPAVLAEAASLEASLHIDQRHAERAEDLLERAALAYRYSQDPTGLARTRIQQANLKWADGEPSQVLRLLDDAAAVLEGQPEPPDLYLKLCTVTGRVNALCQLGRYTQAQRLLHRHLDDYESSDDPYAAALFRGLDGRIALGLGDLGTAEERCRSCIAAYLTLGRDHDAALACLDLADALLAAEKTAELRRLAADLVPLFRSRDLPAETFKSLQHLARAVVAGRLSSALLEQLRRSLGQLGTVSPSPVD